MPFPSITRTALDTQNPRAALRFLGLCQALAPSHHSECTINFTSLAPVSNPPSPPPQTPLPRYLRAELHTVEVRSALCCLMICALSGAPGIKCRRCQAACLSTRRWIPGSYSSSSSRPLLSFTLSPTDCSLTYSAYSPLKRTEIAAIMHKSISKDLITHQRPHWVWFFFFFYSLLGEYKGTFEALALLSLIKSTWGWKLRIWYLWTHASNFPWD